MSFACSPHKWGYRLGIDDEAVAWVEAAYVAVPVNVSTRSDTVNKAGSGNAQKFISVMIRHGIIFTAMSKAPPDAPLLHHI